MQVTIYSKNGKKGTSSDIKDVLEKLKTKIPQIAIRTSLIVGFPGEDERTLKLYMILLKKMNLTD